MYKVFLDILCYFTSVNLFHCFYPCRGFVTKPILVFTIFADHAEFHSLQGVEVKIGEKFRPPKKVNSFVVEFSIHKLAFQVFMSCCL